MEEHSREHNHFLMGILIGGALGVTAALLLAPKSGKELRNDIKEKGNKAIREIKDIYAETHAKTREIIDEARHQADEIKKDITRHLSEGRQKARDILSHSQAEH